MTSYLSRVTALESRLASQTLWSSGKRKRGDWICKECRTRRASRQRRAYGDDSLSIDNGQFPFSSLGAPSVGEGGRAQWTQTPSRSPTQRWRPWGLSAAAAEPSDDRTPVVRRSADVSDEDAQDVLWEGFERIEDEAEQDHLATRELKEDIPVNSSLLAIDYASLLPQALAKNEPDMIARCLYAADHANDPDFIRSIPRTTFAECIRLLQPSNFTEPLTTAHLEISDAMAKHFGLSSINQVAWHHARLLQTVLTIRRNAGVAVGLPEYRMLLRAAQDLGQREMAKTIWHFLLSDGLTPDTACYNYIMSSNVWNGLHQPLARHKVRVIPFYLTARENPRPGTAFANYNVGHGGLKSQVIRVFGDMLKHGAIANEGSFRNVILAAAREGDMTMVKTVLRKVWDIDVNALAAGKADMAPTAISAEEKSPLHPSPKLLFAIAHAFGSNNDIPTALRVVDFVARRFSIDISRDVWNQLFEWTFVLACQRTGAKSKTDGTDTGQLPAQSVLSLWKTMTGGPYFIQPTMGMYNHLIRNLQQRDSPPAMYEKMREGLALYFQGRDARYRAFKKLKRAVDDENGPPLGKSLERLRTQWEHLIVVDKRNGFWCKRWVRLLLSTTRAFSRVDSEMDWALREIPRMLWEWQRFAPALVRYDTIGGMVEIRFLTPEEIETRAILFEKMERERSSIREKVPLFAAEEWVSPTRPSS